MNKLIFFVASRSGGHILPCQVLAQRAKTDDVSVQTVLITGSSEIDKQLANSTGVFSEVVFLPEIGRVSSWWRMPLMLCNMVLLFFKSVVLCFSGRPVRVVATGGFIAIPVCVAAWVCRVPVELYELNAVPGRAILALSFFAKKIYVCFAQSARYFSVAKVEHASYPLRPLSTVLSKQDARKVFGFDASLKTIFLLGGSQGSLFLNAAWRRVLMQKPDWAAHVQVIHQVGANDSFDWSTFYAAHGIKAHTFVFSARVYDCYAAADLVICRAGAGTLFELERQKITYLAIPLAARVNPHQIENIRAMQKISPYAHLARQEAIEADVQDLDRRIAELLQLGQPSGFASNE